MSTELRERAPRRGIDPYARGIRARVAAGLAKRELTRRGHVVISDVFDPELAQTAAREAKELFPDRKWHILGPGSKGAIRSDLKLDRNDRSFGAIRAAALDVSRFLGRPIVPRFAQPGRETVDELFEIEAGSPGIKRSRSSSKDLGPLMAVAPIRGEIDLALGRVGVFRLAPGDLAIFDVRNHSFVETALPQSNGEPNLVLGLTQAPVNKAF